MMEDYELQNIVIESDEILEYNRNDETLNHSTETIYKTCTERIYSSSLFKKKEGAWYDDTPQKKEFRSDIQIMRCLAVVLVTLFHLNIGFFSGGFIGVDIFFVISGYLVVGSIFSTSLNNKFDCFIFLGNRIKRLFPASIICLFFIIILFLIFPEVQHLSGNQGWYDIKWAALHVANIKFYINENQYFRSDNTLSFTLHYWSLALEEQFYLVFPILFLIFYLVFDRINNFNKLTITIFTSIIGVSSLIVCLLPQISSSQKFFLLHTRIWEFLAGSLVSLFQENINEQVEKFELLSYNRLKYGINIFRYILIFYLIICGIFIPSESYPNGSTLIIVIVTCIIIGIDIPIENVLLETIGNWSYSIYLYHYPIIQLFKIMFPLWIDTLSSSMKWILTYEFQIKILAILTLTFAFAILSFYVIEQKSLRFNFPPAMWYIIIIATSCIVAGIAMSLYVTPTLMLSTSVFTNNVSYHNGNYPYILNLDNISLNQVNLLKYNVNVAAHTEFLSRNLDTYLWEKLEFMSITVSDIMKQIFPINFVFKGGKNVFQPSSPSSNWPHLKVPFNNDCILIYGDSNGIHWIPAIVRFANLVGINNVFFASSYDRYKTNNVFDERETREFMEHSSNNIKFQQCNFTISIFARISKQLLTYDNAQLNAFSNRLSKVTEFYAQKGCSVIIEGIPRKPGEHNPNRCLSQEIYKEIKFDNMLEHENKSTVLPVNFIKKCALNANISLFSYRDKITLQGNNTNVSVINMNKFLCYEGLCPANYYDVPIYMDESHLSEGIVFMLSATFVDEMMNTPCISKHLKI